MGAGCARAAAETRSESDAGGGGGRKEGAGRWSGRRGPRESSRSWGGCHGSGGTGKGGLWALWLHHPAPWGPAFGWGSCKMALREAPFLHQPAGTPPPLPASPFGAPFLAEERFYRGKLQAQPPPGEERWPLTRPRRARLAADNGVSAPGRARFWGGCFWSPHPLLATCGAGGSELGPSGDTQPLARAQGAGASWKALSRGAAPAEPALLFDLHLFECDFQSILKPQRESQRFCPAARRALSLHAHVA